MEAAKAVVFDLDGVLVDSEELNIRSALEALRALGRTPGPGEAARIVGRHPADYLPELGSRLGMSEDDVRRALRIQMEIYVRLWGEKARLRDGARDVLARLRGRGLRLGLATSAGRRHVAVCLDKFGLGGMFEVVLTRDDVSRRKPDPEVYIACLARFGLPPGQLVVVEDSIHGVRAARAAGVRCIAIRTAQTPEDTLDGADAMVSSLGELEGLLSAGA
jgi:HAD superfamily hydrolase (TIGR01509 family)